MHNTFILMTTRCRDLKSSESKQTCDKKRSHSSDYKTFIFPQKQPPAPAFFFSGGDNDVIILTLVSV